MAAICQKLPGVQQSGHQSEDIGVNRAEMAPEEDRGKRQILPVNL